MDDLRRLVRQDPGFLCRCALTYNWDVLIRFCAILEATDGNDRNSLLYAARQFRETDQWGNNVLHAACYNRAPVEVVTSVMDAAAAVHSANLQLGLCSSKEEEEVFERNIETSIHLLHLRRARDGSTPLQVACACGASIEVIRTLLEAPFGASVVAVADSTGTTPLSDLVVQYSLERKSPPHVRVFQHGWSFDGWDEASPSILHSAANVAEACPDEITQLIIRSSPGLTSYGPNELFPLHVALKSRRSFDAHKKSRERQNCMIQCLLQRFPQAAARPLYTGRTPLTAALAAGLHWSLHNGKERGPIESLWNLNPSKLRAIDPKTNLPPFALAAIGKPPGQSRSDFDNDRLWLDTIYNLLRQDPLLLSSVPESYSEE